MSDVALRLELSEVKAKLETERRHRSIEVGDLTDSIESLRAELARRDEEFGRLTGWLSENIIFEEGEMKELLTTGFKWIDQIREDARFENERLREELARRDEVEKELRERVAEFSVDDLEKDSPIRQINLLADTVDSLRAQLNQVTEDRNGLLSHNASLRSRIGELEAQLSERT